MRPGEILALTVQSVAGGYADVSQRVYRGDLDSPKTRNGIRKAGLPPGLKEDLTEWLKQVPEDGFLFPSENLAKPLWRDNLWRRYIKPKLGAVKLGWVNFQVLRRTATTCMAELKIDAKVRAHQQGHTPNVNELVYRQVALEEKQKAVTALESALIN
jgi:integrase